MNKKSIFLTVTIFMGVLLFAGCKKEGCTNLNADNYNKKADIDDGSCIFLDSNITDISEDITSPTILNQGTYKICSDLNVVSELTVMPGTTLIMCEGSSITVTSTGNITAIGTEDSTIIIKGEKNQKGFWVGIGFRPNSVNNIFRHVLMSDGGSYDIWENAMVFISNQAEVALENTTFNNSLNFGLYLANEGVLNLFKNNSFGQCNIGISLPANQVYNLDSNSIYSNANINNFIDVRSDTIRNLQFWQATTSPYLIHGLVIEGGLVLSPKTNLLMNSKAELSVINGGYLSAIGNTENPISISGKSKLPGYWAGLKFESAASENKIDHTTISDGGGAIHNQYSNIYVAGRLNINNSTIQNGNSYGLYVKSSALLYANNSLIINASEIENHVTFINNGSGTDANCNNNCTAFFE